MRAIRTLLLPIALGWSCASVQSPANPVAASQRVLVLYDDAGEYGYLGELYATAAGILVSHFGPWHAKPVSQYAAGELQDARALVYIGSSYGQPLPPAFLDDVRSSKRSVLWIHHNLWQLAAPAAAFAEHYGFLPAEVDGETPTAVLYKGTRLSRSPENREGVVRLTGLDARRVEVLGWAETNAGRRLPWAVRSGALTFIGENPLTYIGGSDRYLALTDLLFDLLAPQTPERHRALVRIEDVHPLTSTRRVREFADYLASRGVPFAVAVIPVYVDPRGARNGGRPLRRSLRQSPQMIDALKYAVSKGGTLVLHGYTHQFARDRNPYLGISGEDFEFYQARMDEQGNVVQLGPVPGDSEQWADQRIRAALAEFDAAGLPRPSIFEYPHYAGSAADSRAIAAHLPVAYQRGRYWSGILTGRAPDYARGIEVFAPYVVHDPYGWKVVPETLGHYMAPGRGATPRGALDIGRDARALRVVRDGIASFFFHPIYEVSVLAQVVTEIEDAGYTFVSAADL
jgi:uncharacterized protein YdaL